MNEKTESDEFEEEDAEDASPGGDEVDVDHIMRDVDSQRRRAPKGAEPAWRRLERVMEERRTAELLSDFDDYEIGDGDLDDDDETADGPIDLDAHDEETHADGDAEDDAEPRRRAPAHRDTEADAKGGRKKKKSR